MNKINKRQKKDFFLFLAFSLAFAVSFSESVSSPGLSVRRNIYNYSQPVNASLFQRILHIEVILEF